MIKPLNSLEQHSGDDASWLPKLQPRSMKSIILLALLLASPGSLCCTSFLVDCGDGATVHARTWDFDGELRQGEDLQGGPPCSLAPAGWTVIAPEAACSGCAQCTPAPLPLYRPGVLSRRASLHRHAPGQGAAGGQRGQGAPAILQLLCVLCTPPFNPPVSSFGPAV